MELINEKLDIYERIRISIVDLKSQGKTIQEIRMREETFGLLVNCIPYEERVINYNIREKISFMGIPIVEKELDKEIEWELQT